MTTPASGAIKFSDLQTVFGGSNPISLSEYYAGGSYVDSTATGSGGAIPSSGQVALSDYYSPISITKVITWPTGGEGIVGDLTWSNEASFNDSTGSTAFTTVDASPGDYTRELFHASAPNTYIPADCTVTNVKMEVYAVCHDTLAPSNTVKYCQGTLDDGTTWKQVQVPYTVTSPAWYTIGEGNPAYWGTTATNLRTYFRSTSPVQIGYRCYIQYVEGFAINDSIGFYMGRETVTYTIA